MQNNTSSSIRLTDRIRLFPDSTNIQDDSLFIAGLSLSSLAADHGTPLYIYDRLTLDHSVKSYTDALSTHYPSTSHITYAGKAFLCKSIAEWTQTHNLLVDCTGEGEIGIAVAADIPRENILVHGVNKSVADLKSALECAGTIVVDNLTELKRIQLQITKDDSPEINLWLRLLPGVAVSTHHAHTQTGQHDSKFGMTREEILEAAKFCKENDLPLKGIHFHQGSNFRDPEPLIPAIDMALDLAKEIGLTGEWHFCPGGGWGVAYHDRIHQRRRRLTLAGRSRPPSSCTGSTWTLSTRDFATLGSVPVRDVAGSLNTPQAGTRIERRATCRTKPDTVVSEITGDLDGDLAAWLPLRRNRSRRSPATSRLRSRLRFPQMRAGLVRFTTAFRHEMKHVSVGSVS